MPDDPAETKEDQKFASPIPEYEADDFARKYDISRGEASAMIKHYGPSRSKLDAIMAERFYG